MQRLVLICATFALLAGFAGCNTMGSQPQIRNAIITPSDLKPGDTAIITMKIADRRGIVDRVEGVVLEDPRVTLKLRDDGAEPDKKADDNTWTLEVDVPLQAPPGDFMLEFTAFRSDGEPIVVLDKDRNAVPMRERFGMVINFPQDGQEPEQPPPAETVQQQE